MGWILVRSGERGAVVLGPNGEHYLDENRVQGEDPLAAFLTERAEASQAHRRVPARRRHHGRQLLRPKLDEGCAFEELISFHGGIGGPQTRPFVLAPVTLPPPEQPIVGAEQVHALLTGWRRHLNGDSAFRAGLGRAGRLDARRSRLTRPLSGMSRMGGVLRSTG